MPITLINCFEVPEGKEEEFRAGWLRLTENLQGAAGYLGTTFYKRAVGFVGRFAFINVAKWQDRESWQAAVSTPAFREIVESMKDFPGYAGLFEEDYIE